VGKNCTGFDMNWLAKSVYPPSPSPYSLAFQNTYAIRFFYGTAFIRNHMFAGHAPTTRWRTRYLTDMVVDSLDLPQFILQDHDGQHEHGQTWTHSH
jgi:hypothetical protein